MMLRLHAVSTSFSATGVSAPEMPALTQAPGSPRLLRGGFAGGISLLLLSFSSPEGPEARPVCCLHREGPTTHAQVELGEFLGQVFHGKPWPLRHRPPPSSSNAQQNHLRPFPEVSPKELPGQVQEESQRETTGDRAAPGLADPCRGCTSAGTRVLGSDQAAAALEGAMSP